MIADQRHHLREQLKQMRLKHLSERLKVALQLLTVAVVVGIVATLCWMAFDASRADGVVIKPFTVAPDLARRGVTGEVVASQLLDRLTDISDRSQSASATGNFAAGWGQNISLQIPETGVSLAEVDQFLRDRLGHEHRLTGEVTQNLDGGVTVIARLGAHALPPQMGPAADLPQLLARTAEALYRREQPNTYVQYLTTMGRPLDEQDAVNRDMAESHDPLVRAQGYGGMGGVAMMRGDFAGAVRDYQIADDAHAGLAWPAANIGLLHTADGRLEDALRFTRRGLALVDHDPSDTPQALREERINYEAAIADLLRDHGTGLAKRLVVAQGDNLGRVGSRASLILQVAEARALAHDGARAEREVSGFTPRGPLDVPIKGNQLWRVAYARGDWQTFLDRLDAYEQIPGHFPMVRYVQARKALALAKLGRMAEAQALIAPTPLDCQPCVISRGVIAESLGRRAEADHWFAEASRIAPSIPLGPLYWGQTLLARGDAARAAGQFREAQRRSPHAEEAIVGLGEALLAQGDASGAIKQFAAANALTPRWGRLHLKWSEALAKQGKAADAKAQIAVAAGLDLAASERAELMGQRL